MAEQAGCLIFINYRKTHSRNRVQPVQVSQLFKIENDNQENFIYGQV